MPVNAASIENNVMGTLEESLPQGHRVVMGRGYDSFFKVLTPDMIVLRECQRIPEELEDVENLNNFFHGSEFEFPLFGIEIKYRENSPLAVPKFEKVPRGPHPEKEDQYPEIFFVLNGEAVPETKQNDARNSEWIISSNLTNRTAIEDNVCARIRKRISQIDDIPQQIEEMDGYIEDFRAKVYHFSEVLRGYQQEQTGALVVLLSAFFESFCYSRLEEYVEENKPHEHAGMFLEEDDRMEILFKTCRFFEIIDESEYGAISQIKSARNTYAHGVTGYDGRNEHGITEEEIENAIQVYEDMIGVQKSMVGTD